MKTILFVCVDTNTVINFRKELISFLISRGMSVHVYAGDNNREEEIKRLGVHFYYKKLRNRSFDFFESLKFLSTLKKTIKQIKPSHIFTFSLKSNILGSFAAHKCGVSSCFSMIEGLGEPFVGNSLYKKILRGAISFFYKRTLKYSKKVFFLNNDDLEEFLKRKIIDSNKSVVIPGIGIDNKSFSFCESMPEEKVVVQMARLIKTKGIYDFCRVAEKVKETRPDIIFKLYGQEDEIKGSDLRKYTDAGTIEYCGFTRDTKTAIMNSRIVVSMSSYREGLPRIILEAMAIGRPVIATNVVGNKDVVINDMTGYLLDGHNINLFANKIIDIIDDTELLKKLGKHAKSVCVNKYDSDIINRIIYDTIIY